MNTTKFKAIVTCVVEIDRETLEDNHHSFVTTMHSLARAYNQKYKDHPVTLDVYAVMVDQAKG